MEAGICRGVVRMTYFDESGAESSDRSGGQNFDYTGVVNQ